jgi:serine/threonine-protein phosphatase 2A regulatory subunit A
MNKDEIKESLFSSFEKLSRDEQDSVRLLAVDNCVAMAEKFTSEEVFQVILPIIKSCANDKSWRVRYMLGDHFNLVWTSHYSHFLFL